MPPGASPIGRQRLQIRRGESVIWLQYVRHTVVIGRAYAQKLDAVGSETPRERITMSTQSAEHHRKAAEHHEHAAKHHLTAAEHHEAGNHEKAGHHGHLAHGHHVQAEYHAEEAAKHHTTEHGHME
jgi:hypothetical protein